MQEFNDIFSEVSTIDNYPSKECLEERGIPFAKYLSDLAHDSKNYGAHNHHVREVVVKANRLLERSPSSLVADISGNDSLQQGLDELMHELRKWSVRYRIHSDWLIRAAAVYHDIGKWIVKERHPTEGYYLLRYLFPCEGEKLQGMVGQQAFELLLSVIRDHDKFGIVSMGEASLLVLVDLLNPAMNDVQFYKMATASLMFTNFADIAVTAPNSFQSLQAQWILDDAKEMLRILEEHEGDRLKVSRSLLEMEGSAARITRRIARLVDSCYKNARMVQKRRVMDIARGAAEPAGNIIEDGFNEDDWQPIPYDIVLDAVNTKLQTIFLGQAYHHFCREFAHFCKLDYSLYFFGEVARQFNIRRLFNKETRFPLTDLVAAVILVLKSIVETYRELVHEEEVVPRRIGIQMQSLLRPRVKETVAGFLAGTQGPPSRDMSNVVSWITNEVTAWLFI